MSRGRFETRTDSARHRAGLTPSRAGIGATLALLCSVVSSAQETAPKSTSLTEQVGEAARARLTDPALLDRFGEHVRGGRFLRVFEGLNITPELFERDSGGALALGFSYDMAKRLVEYDEEPRRSIDFVARGHVALDQRSNPDDFQSATFRMRWWGTHTLDGAQSRAEHAEALKNPEIEQLASIDGPRVAELSARAGQVSLEGDADFQALVGEYCERLQAELAPELVWDFDMHAGLESTQDLSDRQLCAGSSISGRLISWDPEARLSRYNPFDFPSAALRWLAGEDESRSGGLSYPTLVLGLDVVDASRDSARRALTDQHSFLRSRVELGSRSHLVDLAGEPLFLSLAWRYYQELDPPGAVRAADNDDASQIELGLDLPRGWEVFYRAGRLPLDTHDDSTFGLGFALRL